eukprot:CAMPEP_0201555090 /NCGR_PEP_ID=MMETSP0173_2-20130828/46475_1 /ASSEMBLY_ACC=CAM_ASM_000268 /TAXON_ID=218659 /ORGANISM="Vexillifera sp., Strain DIVA3 564/2" /LENGTH=174 /DNA_ID=CAMNT_0047966701 /DNA_START=15 /DNA_END=536 /DNA_ORIENTATION=-
MAHTYIGYFTNKLKVYAKDLEKIEKLKFNSTTEMNSVSGRLLECQQSLHELHDWKLALQNKSKEYLSTLELQLVFRFPLYFKSIYARELVRGTTDLRTILMEIKSTNRELNIEPIFGDKVFKQQITGTQSNVVGLQVTVKNVLRALVSLKPSNVLQVERVAVFSINETHLDSVW